ncbi:P-loop containing nucleoside triphosphate hydrolase protein [Apiospora phragmitis]|uniref:P-loop containing nucleoside triphosphate hydrolase protein n=1 Tax=Apiospora phragmitis TaxID=2905665 RepID=A0ABR1TB53_9PEZI
MDADLELIPMHYVAESDAVRSRLLARGKKFITLHGQHHLLYDGIGSFVYDEEDYRYRMVRGRMKPLFNKQLIDDSRIEQIKSRIMVDRAAFVEAYPYTRISFTSSQKVFHANDGGAENMTTEELIICSDLVYGYSLRHNAWGRFRIDNMQDIGLDSSAFEELILQQTYKQQILSLVQVHEDTRLQFDDFIKGKGRGVVFLLYGAPGTGKTLTAGTLVMQNTTNSNMYRQYVEGIADYCRKPLLRLDAGTLGTTAKSVEEQLSAAFEIAEKWHAVVLLDEADVFLEQREPHGLLRNALVSVFLRMLEYYQGILILTTNRVDCFDTAFKSRIHLAIRYPPLSISSRRVLWHAFLRKVSEQTANELKSNGALEKFASEPLNGRQIKNLIRTASALVINDEEAGREGPATSSRAGLGANEELPGGHGSGIW